MRRLAIVDIAGGHQPMRHEASDVTLVFNGEIYNHAELRAEVEASGEIFHSDHSDTEVILHLYLRHGPDFVKQLNGMFAIAIADGRDRKLWLFRDRFGERPLYYRISPDGFIFFASEFNSLALTGQGHHLNGDSLRWFFGMKAMPDDQTIDTRIRRLPAGCRLLWRHGREPEIGRYYDMPRANDALMSFEEAADAFQCLLRDAVALRLRADVEVGAYLSGGVDSSLITAVAASMLDHPLRTYCLVYDEEVYQKSADRRFACMMSRRLGTRHEEVVLTPEILRDALPLVARQYGQPNAVAVANWFVSQVMRRDIKVALTGDGADELFGSYFVHRAAAVLEQDPKAAWVPEAERQFVEALPSINVATLYGRFAVFSNDEIEALLSPEAPSGTSVKDQLEIREAGLRRAGIYNRVLEYEVRHQLVEQILNYVDVLSMAHAVEPRVPYLDHRLVELVSSLPSPYKNRQGQTKRLLKRVAEAYLPTELIHRPKEGFIEPNVHWLGGPLKSYAIDIFTSPSFNKLGLLRTDFVHKLMNTFFKTNDFNLGKKVWLLLQFALWEREASQ
jgi:asparagine synthase (glutamine-hydrolysing)